jgi:hypothetical protein
MLITSRVRVPFLRSWVYKAYRDNLPEIVHDLKDIRSIEITSRSQEENHLCVISEWLGGGEIPAIARPLVSESMLSWTDVAIWHDADFTTNWIIKTHAFTEAVHCTGWHHFLEDGNSTIIESNGELTIDPHQIHGVPQFFAATIGHVVEDVLRQKIDLSLQQVAQGVHHYLEQHSCR